MAFKPAGKPSDKLNPKTVDHFSNSKKKSTFATLYESGSVPCRLMHGSVKHKLQWTVPPEQVNFNTTLLALAEGLSESIHPYNFIAQNGFEQLLQVNDAQIKVTPVLPSVIPPLRTALSSDNVSVAEASLKALGQLSAVAGPQLNVHLKLLLVPISRHMRNKSLQDLAVSVLQEVESNSGPESTAAIKQKIPTYRSMFQ